MDQQEQLEELHRMKRDIDENGFNMNDYYRDMTEMDQDSCGKKLICELRSKEASGVSMTVRECQFCSQSHLIGKKCILH